MQHISEKAQEVLNYADALVGTHSALLDELAIWKYRVHSTMFIASATILTLVCSLGRPISGNPGGIFAGYPCCTYWISIAIVSLNGICLIALLFSLYQNIHATDSVKRNIEAKIDELKAQLKIPRDDAVYIGGEYKTISGVDKSRFFLVCEIVAYISFVLMISGLIFRYCFM